jgi:uncharacterized protein YndB with AHSA1/START domain
LIKFRFGHIEVSRELRASSETVWELITDTLRWAQWGPSIISVECHERFIKEGSKGRVRTLAGIWIPFMVTQFDPPHSWAWRIFGIPATGHRVEPVKAGFCRLVFEIPILALPYAVVCQIALQRIAGIVEE